MYRTMKRILLLLIWTYLTIAIILTNKVHSSFLCICKVIANIFQLPSSHLFNDSFSAEDDFKISMPGETMYQTMERILLLLISTYLTIAIMLANEVHSSFLCICKVIADIFQLPWSHLLNDSFSAEDFNTTSNPHCNRQTVSFYVQTGEDSKQLKNVDEKNCSCDVVVYKLSSNQRLVITRGQQRKSCKLSVKISRSKECKVSTPSTQLESANSSKISIESERNVEIKNCNLSSLTSSKGNATLYAFSDCSNIQLPCREDSGTENLYAKKNCNSFEFFDNTSLNSSNENSSLSEGFSDFGCLLDDYPANTDQKCNGADVNVQKASSPLKNVLERPKSPESNSNMLNGDHSQITENKDAGVSAKSDCLENDSFSSSLNLRLNSSNMSKENDVSKIKNGHCSLSTSLDGNTTVHALCEGSNMQLDCSEDSDAFNDKSCRTICIRMWNKFF